jgi:conjugal transfer ATP-binding protein TraC
MRTIPKASKVKLTFYKGITIPDIIIGIATLALIAVTLSSNFWFRFYLAGIILCVVIPLYLPVGDERLYIHIGYFFRYLFSRKKYDEKTTDYVIPYRKVEDDVVYCKDNSVFSAIEIKPINFGLLNEDKQDELIDYCYSRILNSINSDCEWILEKIEMPIVFDDELQSELNRADKIRKMQINGEITEDEFVPRCDAIQSRICEIDELNSSDTLYPRYYLCLTGISSKVVKDTLDRAIDIFASSGIKAHRLNEKELLTFIKASNSIDVDPRIELKTIHKPNELRYGITSTNIDGRICSTFLITKYPLNVPYGWAEGLFSTENTKVTMRMKPIEKNKAIRRIDNAILELGTKNVSKESQLQESGLQVDTLQELLQDIQQSNETLFDTTILVSIYDNDKKLQNKKYVKTRLNEMGFGFSELISRQEDGFISSMISMTNLIKEPYGIQTSSLAASFPFSGDILMDDNGIMLGENSLPTFLNPFKRDLTHVNSNMVVIGQSGGGKSFATKKLLANLASDGSKVYVLDPESEYGILANNLGGVRLDASDGNKGRINPLEIMTTMDDEGGSSNSFYSHLQFLEQFYRVILDGISHDALEMLNRLTEETYSLKGIGPSTSLSKLKPEDYPTFEDLCNHIDDKLKDNKDDYESNCIKTVSNWIGRFRKGCRDSSLWNGVTTFSPKENFIDFDFQRLLANHNDITANAQMLLLLRWLENEVIKNRDYNRINHTDRKIVITIDEAHLFIDEKYPIALDFMYQMAKRIRKYDGMLIIITQNVKDFTGTPETAKKASSIINVSQYSMIFPLSSDDMTNLANLYEASGGFNDVEKERIIHNPRGTCFFIDSASKRGIIEISADDYARRLFEEDTTK